MGQLITPSILAAADWAKTAPLSIVPPEHGGDGKITWREKAYLEFKGQIRREDRGEPSEAIKRGIRFEDAVYELADRWDSDYVEARTSEPFREILEEVAGGKFQHKVSKDLAVDGQIYTLYGRLDVYFEGCRIIDIKTTGKYRPPEYYLKTAQHLIYCYSTGVKMFSYRVAVINDDGKLEQTYTVYFEAQNMKNLEYQITGRIRRFRQFLIENGLLSDYEETFCKRK